MINLYFYTSMLKYPRGQLSPVGDDESGQGSTNKII
jgi:hypothetical protein